MCRRDVLMIGLIAVLTGSLFSSSGAADQNARTHGYGLGQPATEQDIQTWNIDVAPTAAKLLGLELPNPDGKVLDAVLSGN